MALFSFLLPKPEPFVEPEVDIDFTEADLLPLEPLGPTQVALVELGRLRDDILTVPTPDAVAVATVLDVASGALGRMVGQDQPRVAR